ncbi:EAL domain-containing protein [Acanthopleuribacter pedis]|uniref:EAL domain-containing protein n=1 Tax=Acanthopleuribacter pedis TaxID=442870 RepID=A0A8J7U2L6_9BACT|nr:EAL domain-containing protein [Acanthopleuribacter pedis]MBO1318722.1 EAL domain-containing protein [Acanthopleuribacter pedis]
MPLESNLQDELEQLRKERDAFAKALKISNDAFVTKVKEFSLIKRMGALLRWNPQLSQLVAGFVNIIIDETYAENCSLWLVQPGSSDLVLTAAQGQQERKPRLFLKQAQDAPRMKMGEGAAGWAAKNQRSLLIENVAKDARFVPKRSEITSIKSLLCLPIMGEHGDVLGVFNMSHPDIGAFSMENQRLLELITDQAGLAFTNYNLIKAMRDFNKLLERKVEEHTQTLRDSEERYALAVEAGRVGIWDWNLQTDNLYLSPNMKELLGYGNDELNSDLDTWMALVHTADRGALKHQLDKLLDNQANQIEWEHRMFHRDGSVIWFALRGRLHRDAHNQPQRLVVSYVDITKRKSMEKKLTYSALHDDLTGLPNRTLFIDRLRQALAFSHRRPNYHFAILFLDLDHFKIINDSLGHHVGDLLLKQVAHRLQGCVRNGDTVARLGGDEFAILFDGIQEVAQAEDIAQLILKRLQQVFVLERHEVFTGGSIGIALPITHKETPDELLRDADIALYRAKKLGRARFEVFDKSLHLEVLSRLELEYDLRLAMEQQQILPFYQPIVDLRTGKITGFEALARWKHPVRGMVPPAEFIPIAEETGLINDISRHILQCACRDVVTWQQAFPHTPPLSMSVNLSTIQFLEGDLVPLIRETLDSSGLEAQRLKLEITESLLMEELDVVRLVLSELRGMNIPLLLDDFGTGYSSLSYLHRFPLNVVKIDASFVRNLHLGQENLEIVRAIKMLAMALNMEVIAEGIESEIQMETLKDMGCEFGQGFFFAKPLPREEIPRLLEQQVDGKTSEQNG